MPVLVDGRVGWGSGIGRVIAQTVPRVAALMPETRFHLLVLRSDVARVMASITPMTNLSVLPCDIEPFSISEQFALPRFARAYSLTWFTNYFVPLRFAGPFVVTVHDLLHLNASLFPAGRIKRALSRATFGKVRRDARAVMFDSRFTAREFSRLIGAPRVERVVHLGADHLIGDAAGAEVAREKRVLVVAASKQHKNFSIALEAWAAARVDAEWRLTVVSPKDALRTSIDIEFAAVHSERVEVMRGITDAELASLYRRSSIILMPSRYEGFGLPLLEAMRAGMWCISSTAPALVEIAEGAFAQFVDGDDVTGWTGAIEWACAQFDCNTDLLSPLLQQNQHCARQFTWAQTADKIAAVLSDHPPAQERS